MKLNTVYIMKHVEIPISIVECGFLSNPEEEVRLNNPAYQMKICSVITSAVCTYIYKA